MSLIVKKSLFHTSSLLIPALLVMLGTAASCNSKSDNNEEVEAAVTVSTVAVKNFNLKSDSKVLSNLDSVFFSIDLNRGIIFNADSLPKGTNITKLIPVITFPTSMSKAEIVMSGGKVKEGTVDYLENPNDSIDFSGKVTLNVTAYDGVNKYSYSIKVNVHEQNPDSLMWGDMAASALPSRLAAPLAQKSVKHNDKVVSLIREADNSLTLSRCADLMKGEWTRTAVSLPFVPDIASLEAAGNSLYILDNAGSLFSSTDGETWSDTGEKWAGIVGPYLGSVLGIKATDSGLMHCHYPANPNITDTAVDPEFPLSERSAFKTISSEWSQQPVGIFVGGVKPSGELSAATWAFDGSRWATIDNTPTPALRGATLVRYVEFRSNGNLFQRNEYETWVVIGGRLENGDFNKTIYVSPDNGITWKKGSELMQLPDYFPAISSADGIIMDNEKSANLSDAWTRFADTRSPDRWLRSSVTIDGYEVSWKCPYIYIIGGIKADGSLSDTIWRGVLTRLTFQPLV